jgi:cation diffusion facilitator CzcD-associated flavoprotein CzcO
MRETEHVRACVIGAGLSGICAAVALRDAGIEDFVVLDRGDDVGGTWRDNTYPGCACDVPSALYSFSFAPKPDWSRLYAPQPEIQDYVRDVARQVERHVRVGVEVLGAAWDDAAQRWRIETSDGDLTAHVLIAGAGPWHEPLIPDLPGLAEFPGPVFHSSRWDHDADLRGKRVAVVGSGASAVQFVPEIQPHVAQLHLFQRTPHWVLPKPDRHTPRALRAYLQRVPGAQRAWRETLYHGFELLGLAMRHPRAMRALQRVGERHLRRQIPDDADLRARMTPDYTLGCKRILMSNNFYASLTRPNVEVIPSAVSEVRRNAVVGADGVEREVDAIIFGTGFHILDMPIAGLVRGRDGRTLAEVWQGSPRAYLGTTVAGFPNAFILLGPNMGNGHSSATILMEAQANYIADAIRALDRHDLASIDVDPDVQRAFNERVDQALQGSVWNAGGCGSYYLDANGRNSFMYPWSTLDFRRRTRRFDLHNYRTTARRRAPVAVPA